MEGLGSVRRQRLTENKHYLITTYQDTELILFSGKTKEDLKTQLSHLLGFSYKLSYAEIADLSTKLNENLDKNLPVRAAIITNKADDLSSKLEKLINLINEENETNQKLPDIFWGRKQQEIKIGFLFFKKISANLL